MNKHNHTLEELLRAAREEQPVVSFSETAEQIGRLEQRLQERKRGRGIAWLWEKAFAFPLQTGRNIYDAISNIVFVPNVALHPAFTRLASGVAIIGAVMFLFPELVHDTYFAGASLSKSAQGNSVQNLALQSSQSDVNQQTPEALPHLPRFRKYASQGVQNLAFAPINVASDSANGNTDSEVKTPEDTLALASSTLALSTTESGTHPIEALRSAAKEAAHLPRQKQTQRLETTEQAVASAPEAVQERTFWQHLSFDARVATRTSLTAPTDASFGAASEAKIQTFKAQQQLASEAASPLQNIALGVMYALDNHHSFGVEGGTEPFLAMTPTSTAQTDGSGGDNNNLIGIATTPGRGNTVPPTTTTIAETRNRAWFGAAYQYSFPIIETLGGIQPLTRITLGGGEIGLVSRAIVGVRFLPQNQVSVLLAGEGAGIARQNGASAGASSSAAWEFSPKLGMTLGLAVKF